MSPYVIIAQEHQPSAAETTRRFSPNKEMNDPSYRFLPGCCVLCDHWSFRRSDLCFACETDLPWIRNNCRYCGVPLAVATDLCLSCVKKPPNFSAVFCPLVYRFPVDVLIYQFKNQRRLASGKVLTDLLLQQHKKTLSSLIDRDTLLVPVPLHWTRRRVRGFNQAAFIANRLAKTLNVQASPGIMRITRLTPAQKHQSRTSRSHNLKGAFEVKQSLEGKRIILVDDVVTTAATATEASRCLLLAGAADVVIAALARTPDPRD